MLKTYGIGGMPPPPGPPVPQDCDCQRGDRAVLFRRDFDASVSGRPRARDLQLRVALQHDAHRLAAGFFGKPRSGDIPAIGGKLAAKAAADIVLMNADVGCRDSQRLRHLRRDAGNILRGDVGEEMIFVGPLRNRTVRFEATVNDHRRAVETFRDNLGFGESLVGISPGLCRSFLIVGVAAALHCVIWGLADGVENGVGGAIAFHVIQEVIVDFEADAVLL